MERYIKHVKRLHNDNKRLLIIVVLSILMFLAVSAKIADIKLNSGKEIPTLQKEYEKYGLPVFAEKIRSARINFFSVISIEKFGNKFIAYVDRTVFAKIYNGSMVILHNGQDDMIVGSVSDISGIVDLDSGGHQITISFDKPVKLRSTFETALISIATKNAITVNNDHIGNDASGEFVWLIKDNLLHKQYVKTGLVDGFKTEIKSGLRVGDIIVASDLKPLKEGKRIRIVDAF
ncbi:MAG: hypothetical protein LBU68_00010 [Rickettsiales bacterium]|jgi:hypothetical protein|nr:hypothetical protein [Rickettsiales bacterium]